MIKKIVSELFPNGGTKEYIKLLYYRVNKPKHTFFELDKNVENKLVFKTTFKQVELTTNEALYYIVPDFNYYQYFYKVKENDIVLDAGANFGHLSILFSKLVKKDGFVYAFEPDSQNVERIKNNKNLNKDFASNIKIEEVLLWNENKLIDFNEAGTAGSSAVYINELDKCVKKQAVRIDDWIVKNNITKLDFIKMDIEGAEIEALDGCVQTILNLKPNFAIASYHIVDGAATYIKVEEFFKNLDYPFKTVQFKGNETITFAGKSVCQ